MADSSGICAGLGEDFIEGSWCMRRIVDGVDLPAVLAVGDNGVPSSETMDEIIDKIDFDLSGTVRSDECCCGRWVEFRGIP
jgi:hypothetical protein